MRMMPLLVYSLLIYLLGSQNRAADIKTIQYYGDGVRGSARLGVEIFAQRGLSYDITTTAATVVSF